ILKAPEGTLIIDHHYYTFSSIFFYTDRPALLLNGRFHNLEYGAYAPGVPDVFIDDLQFKNLWLKPERAYISAKQDGVPRLELLVGAEHLSVVAASGGKVVLTNLPLTVSGGESTAPLVGAKTAARLYEAGSVQYSREHRFPGIFFQEATCELR